MTIEFHLLEYKQRELEYLQSFGDHPISPFTRNSLVEFSIPNDVDGYADDPITDDLITDVFLGFSDHMRQSEEYMRTLTGLQFLQTIHVLAIELTCSFRFMLIS